MRGPEGIWNFPGIPRDTVDYTFADTDKHTLSEMGAVLTTRQVYDDYIHANVYITSGSVYFGYGTGSNGVSLNSGENKEFYGLEQCNNVWFKSTIGSELSIFIDY